ncbi:MAG: HAD-IA family hydrolase [Lachnospiraceae bacterium]|nr:HAD-IA family hydrolase [Lachnospiraceae bacterium]
MKYKNILFDLDGTLTDSSDGIIKSVLYAYKKLGITPPDEEVLKTFIGPPLGDSFIKHSVPKEDEIKAVDIFRERYNVKGKFENRPYPGIIDLLKELKEEGYRLYVATSKPEITAKEVLEHFDMAKYFDEIAGATLDGSREKKNDVIEYLLKKQGIEDDIVMVGDTIYDVVGAKKLDLPCIAVTWGFGDIEDMKEAGAICIVKNMEELKNAIH